MLCVEDQGEDSENRQNDLEHTVRKPYAKPQITHELVLETRAGSRIGGPTNLFNPADPFSMSPSK